MLGQFTKRLEEALQLLAGFTGTRQDHAVRFKDLPNAVALQAAKTANVIVEPVAGQAESAAAAATAAGTIATAAAATAATADANANAALSNQAEYLAFRVQSNSAGALLELIAASDPVGAVSVARVEAQNILLKGSVAADFLTVGLGRNRLANARFRHGTASWAYTESGLMADETVFSLRAPTETWSGGFFPTLMMEQIGVETTGETYVEWYDLTTEDGVTAPGVPVKPDDWIEVSANISAHRCDVTVHVVFYQDDGTFISETVADPAARVQNDLGSADQPDLWERPYAITQAPALAAFASIRIRKGGTGYGGANSYCFIHKPQLAESHEFATLASSFSEDGNTLIGPGGILTGSLNADDIQAGTMSVSYLVVDELLEIDAINAGFQMGKTSAGDETSDGIFLGRTDDGSGGLGFGFAVGILDAGGKQQQITGTESDGVRSINVQHFRDLNVSGAANVISTSQQVILPPGTLAVALEGIGGGKGGSGTSSTADDGGDTTVELFDGAVSQGIVLTAPGATHTLTAPPTSGQNSPYGNGAPGSGGDAGTEKPEGEGTQYGDPGGAASIVSVLEVDTSGLTDPRLTITIGAGGARGSQGGTFPQPASDGLSGQLIYRVRNSTLVRADVVPLKPTASGSFFKADASAFDFPDLGAGMWTIWQNVGGALELNDVEVDDDGAVIYVRGNSAVTFVSSKTPRCLGGDGTAQTIEYAFYKMGD